MIKLSNKSKLLKCIYALLIGVLTCASMLIQAATTEDAVKAGSIYNFTKFVIWPNDISAKDNFYLCVFSKNKPNAGLQALSGKFVADKLLVIRHINNDNNIKDCHMVFIPNDSNNNVQIILNKVTKLPILTVSDSPDFINNNNYTLF